MDYVKEVVLEMNDVSLCLINETVRECVNQMPVIPLNLVVLFVFISIIVSIGFTVVIMEGRK